MCGLLLARASGRIVWKAAPPKVLQQTGQHPTGGSERPRNSLQELLLVALDAYARPFAGHAPAIAVSTDDVCSTMSIGDFFSLAKALEHSDDFSLPCDLSLYFRYKLFVDVFV